MRRLAALLIISGFPFNARVDVYFSPGGGCTAEAVRLIGQARHNIHVQSYAFTSKPIRDALIEANGRGVKVAVILDKRMASQAASVGKSLAESGIPVWRDGAHAIAHNKVIVLDDDIVIGGSFNYTASAESRNAENMTVIVSKDVAKLYLDNWTLHLGHSEK
jgi:phosphatidylserine/phosphatidylglycerophosphate/cardiolipin synthase-like enzyme